MEESCSDPLSLQEVGLGPLSLVEQGDSMEDFYSIQDYDYVALDSEERHLPEAQCFYNTSPTNSFLPVPRLQPSTSTKIYARHSDVKGSVSREDPFKDNACSTKKVQLKNINFVDLDNKGTFYRNEEEKKQRDKKKKKKRKKKTVTGQDVQESDFAHELCKVEGEQLKQSTFHNYHSCHLDQDHLNTECVQHLRDLGLFHEVQVGMEKNAADARMVADIVQLHYKEDKDVGFSILSGDRGFEAIREQLHGRKVQHLNLHDRYNQRDINLKAVVRGPTNDNKNSQQTDLGKCISLLAQSTETTKVYFVHAMPGCLPDELENCLKDPGSAMLVFRMQPEENQQYLDPPWMDMYKSRLWIHQTEREKKEDAPLFLLEFAALALHYEAVNTAAEFNIKAEKETEFLKEVENRCEGCTVRITTQATAK